MLFILRVWYFLPPLTPLTPSLTGCFRPSALGSYVMALPVVLWYDCTACIGCEPDCGTGRLCSLLASCCPYLVHFWQIVTQNYPAPASVTPVSKEKVYDFYTLFFISCPITHSFGFTVSLTSHMNSCSLNVDNSSVSFLYSLKSVLSPIWVFLSIYAPN